MGAPLKVKHLGGLFFLKHYKELLDFPIYLFILIILLNFWTDNAIYTDILYNKE